MSNFINLMKAPKQNDVSAVRTENSVTPKTNAHAVPSSPSKFVATQEQSERQKLRYILVGEWEPGYNFYELYSTKKSAIRARMSRYNLATNHFAFLITPRVNSLG